MSIYFCGLPLDLLFEPMEGRDSVGMASMLAGEVEGWAASLSPSDCSPCKNEGDDSSNGKLSPPTVDNSGFLETTVLTGAWIVQIAKKMGNARLVIRTISSFQRRKEQLRRKVRRAIQSFAVQFK